MKTIPLIIAASCALLGSQAHADTFTVDPEHTMVQFSVERLGYSQTLGFFAKLVARSTLTRLRRKPHK